MTVAEAPPRVILELGCGKEVSPGATIRHDRIAHSPHVDVAWDLDLMPWPWSDESVDDLFAIDVIEHLHHEVDTILNECHRILRDGGTLTLRVPAWNHPLGLGYRDPTHVRPAWHPETFLYWDPRSHHWELWGSIYFAEAARWWHVEHVENDAGDIGVVMRKLPHTTG